MSKKTKIKKTLVDQILDKAGIAHDSLVINAKTGKLPEDIAREDVFKTLALIGDKTGPIIGILPITEHLAEKKLAKISGNKKVHMIPQRPAKINQIRFPISDMITPLYQQILLEQNQLRFDC